MKRKIVPIIVILVIIGAAAEGYWYFSQNPTEFTQLQVRLGLITETEASGIHSASGFIEAEEVSTTAETRGRIIHITVAEGDFVEAGQVLVELDTALLETEIQQAEAKIEAAQAQLDKVNAGIRAEEIAKAEAAVAVAQAKAEAARVARDDAILLRDNPQELDIQIDAAKTALDLAEFKIAYTIPLKDAAEALYALGQQGWETAQEGIDWSIKLPNGTKKSGHFDFPEGDKQQAGVAWNFAGADQWEAWVNLNSAITERDDAQTVLNDLQRLRNDPQEAQIKVDQAEAAYQAALAEVAVAQAQVDVLNAGPRQEQVAIVEAQVEQAQAALDALEVQGAKHTLVAPSNGWVVKKTAHEGEMATPGMTLLTLADLTNVTLTVYVPEPDVGAISINQEVKVYVDSFPGEPFTGHITYISDKAEFTPKNVQTKEERVNTVFAVKIKLDNPDQRLKPGMPADAILSQEQPDL
ncbi:MAG: efflux RND transporter periplasmic adaptor subunit [Anaerolineae bacterium]|nr:efflux RND transporter periplasmic adaptor subunit [Anaerolineae bacterium]